MKNSIDLKTDYLGLKLKNPIIVGASNLVTDLNNLTKIEKAGAAAVVYKSLFEEQIQWESYEMDQMQEIYSDWDAEHATIFPELGHAGPAEHLLKLKRAKQALSIPLIGSLNAVLEDTWIDYAKEMANTGIDALELNFYTSIVDSKQNSIEEEQLNILKKIKSVIKIPVSVKLSPYYTNTLAVIENMDKAGADGFVLFNRLFQPDIDIESEEHHFPYNFSSQNDNRITLRYAGLLHKNVEGSICSNTGIFTGKDVIKMILAGADTVQVVSTIYKKGIFHIEKMLDNIKIWMKKKKYRSLKDFRGKLSEKNVGDSFAYKRAQYIDILLKTEIYMRYHPKENEKII